MKYQIISERSAPSYRIAGPADAFKAFERYAKAKTEWFLVASLSAAHEVLKVRVVAIGLVSRCLVGPKEIFVGPVTDLASAVILCHTHPSGRHEIVSDQDIEVSMRLAKAGQILGIEVLDSLVISRKGFTSLKERGLFNS